jgi:hypothetical protein
MPPCNWMHSSATRVPVRPIVYLAADRARSRVPGDRPSSAAAALITAERACSISSSRSAMRCCRAWKLPIGTCRTACGCAGIRASSLLATVHRAHRLGAQREHATPTRARSWRSAPPSAPSRASGATRTGQRHFGGAAAVDGRIAAQPQAGRAGRHDEQRDAGFVVDRAAGAGRDDEASACSAWAPRPWRRRAPVRRRPRWPACSRASARVRNRARHGRRWRCACQPMISAISALLGGLPACAIALPASTVARKGSTTRPRPSASKTVAMSKPPPPKPPSPR